MAKNDILALFPDNVTGDISEEDIRTLVSQWYDHRPVPVPALSAFSLADQVPEGLDQPLSITFGGPQDLPDLELGPDGLLTFKTSGTWWIQFLAYPVRQSSAGLAQLFFRTLVNGSQAGPPLGIFMDDNGNTVPFITNDIFTTSPGDTLAFQLARSGPGQNSGRLSGLATSTQLGWGSSPSALLNVYKIPG